MSSLSSLSSPRPATVSVAESQQQLQLALSAGHDDPWVDQEEAATQHDQTVHGITQRDGRDDVSVCTGAWQPAAPLSPGSAAALLDGPAVPHVGAMQLQPREEEAADMAQTTPTQVTQSHERSAVVCTPPSAVPCPSAGPLTAASPAARRRQQRARPAASKAQGSESAGISYTTMGAVADHQAAAASAVISAPSSPNSTVTHSLRSRALSATAAAATVASGPAAGSEQDPTQSSGHSESRIHTHESVSSAAAAVLPPSLHRLLGLRLSSAVSVAELAAETSALPDDIRNAFRACCMNMGTFRPRIKDAQFKQLFIVCCLASLRIASSSMDELYQRRLQISLAALQGRKLVEVKLTQKDFTHIFKQRGYTVRSSNDDLVCMSACCSRLLHTLLKGSRPVNSSDHTARIVVNAWAEQQLVFIAQPEGIQRAVSVPESMLPSAADAAEPPPAGAAAVSGTAAAAAAAAAGADVDESAHVRAHHQASPAMDMLDMDGSLSQCLYQCFFHATGMSLASQRERMLTLLGELGPAACQLIGLINEPTQRALDNYIQSDFIVKLMNGSTAEAELLSLIFDGKYRLVTITPEHADPTIQTPANRNHVGNVHCAPTMQLVMQSDSIPAPYARLVPNPSYEIVICHGSYLGQGSRNHFDLLAFKRPAADGVFSETKPLWPIDQTETESQRHARHQSYVEFYRAHNDGAQRSLRSRDQAEDGRIRRQMVPDHERDQATIMNQAKADHAAAMQARDSYAAVARRGIRSSAAAAPAGPGRGSAAMPAASEHAHQNERRSAHPSARGNGVSGLCQSSTNAPVPVDAGDATVPTAPAPIRSAPPQHAHNLHASLWKQRRPNVVRELARKSQQLFTQGAAPVFEQYRQFSEKCDWRGCHVVAVYIHSLVRRLCNKSRGGKGKPAYWFVSKIDTQAELNQFVQQERANDTAESAASAPVAQSLSLPMTVASAATEADVPAAADTVGALPSPSASQSPDRAQATSAQDRAIDRAVLTVRAGAPHALSRAARGLSQSQLAELNAQTMAQLDKLHPQASEALPPLPAVHDVPLVELDLSLLTRVITDKCHNGAAPGPSGWTGSHLRVLWERLESSPRKGLELFIRDICNGVFSGHVKDRLLACTLIPVAKPNDAVAVRPIAIGDVFVKCASHYIMMTSSDLVRQCFPSIQYGVKSAGGSETAAQLIRHTLSQSLAADPTTIAISTDFKNAFNSISRKLVWDTLLKDAKTHKLLKAFHWQYSQPTSLLVYDGNQLYGELQSSDGVRQGDPFSAFVFALTVHKLYTDALASASSCHGISIQDDFTIIGPAAEAMKVFDFVKQHAKSTYTLDLTVEKCKVHIPQCAERSESALREIELACSSRSLSHSASIHLLGVRFGVDSEVAEHCDGVVQDSETFFAALTHPKMPVQIASLLLRYCGIPRLNYLTRTVRPDLIQAACAAFDQRAQTAFLTAHQLDDAKLSALACVTADDDTSCLVSDSAAALGNHAASLARVTKEQLLTRISLPTSSGGCGVRPMDRVKCAAYFSSLLQALPPFLRSFPHLADGASDAAKSCSMFQELEMCRQTLVDAGAAEASSARLPLLNAAGAVVPLPPAKNPVALTISELWSAASECGSDSESGADKLQHQITERLEEQIYSGLFKSCSPYQQTIMTSLSGPADTSAWLNVLPTLPEYSMRDEHYRLAMYHRLGLLPDVKLRDETCVECKSTRNAIPAFLSDPDHLHSCIRHTGASVTRRHNRIKETVVALAKSVGYACIVEPSFPPVLESLTDPTTGQMTQRLDATHERGDILLLRHNAQLLVDVTVTRPTAMHELTKDSAKVVNTPLHTADQAEKLKRKRYGALCTKRGWSLAPFAMESYGARGRAANKLLETMAEHSTDYAPQDFIKHASCALSVALQIGNAEIASHGATALFVRKYRQQHQPSYAIMRAPYRNQTNKRMSEQQMELHMQLQLGPSAVSGVSSCFLVERGAPVDDADECASVSSSSSSFHRWRPVGLAGQSAA